METKKVLSFVILTWNSEKYIKNCLDSILRISEFTTKICVIDNGSVDQSKSLLEEYEKNNSNIKVVYLNENVGTTKSRNMGLNLIGNNADYICILDSDTIVNSKAYVELTKVLDENLNIGIVAPRLKNSKGEYQKSGRKFPNLKIKFLKACPIKKWQKIGEDMERQDIKEGINYVDYLISAFWLMRKDTYEKIGLLDENIFYAPEDVDYCMRVYKNDLKCALYYNCSIIHEYQRISKKKFFSKINYLHLKGLIYYFIKYKYFMNPYKK